MLHCSYCHRRGGCRVAGSPGVFIGGQREASTSSRRTQQRQRGRSETKISCAGQSAPGGGTHHEGGTSGLVILLGSVEKDGGGGSGAERWWLSCSNRHRRSG